MGEVSKRPVKVWEGSKEMRASLIPTWLQGFEKEAGYTMKKKGSFTTPLVVSPLPSGKRWELVFSFRYHVGSKYSRDIVAVPSGFRMDFASIPKFLWFLPYWAKYSKASVLHDWFYQKQDRTRKEADDIFLEAMLVSWRNHRLGKLLAHTFYWAVRLFGWIAWERKK